MQKVEAKGHSIQKLKVEEWKHTDGQMDEANYITCLANVVGEKQGESEPTRGGSLGHGRRNRGSLQSKEAYNYNVFINKTPDIIHPIIRAIINKLHCTNKYEPFLARTEWFCNCCISYRVSKFR